MNTIYEQLERLESKVLETEELINRNISAGKITPETVKSFEELEKSFAVSAENFYSHFKGDLLQQTITYGASKTTGEVCGALKTNLQTAKDRHDNPIAAERVINRRYLFYIGAVVSSLKSVSEMNKLDRAEYVLINESVRTLLHLATGDNVLTQETIPNANPQTSAAIANVLNKTSELFSEDNQTENCTQTQ